MTLHDDMLGDIYSVAPGTDVAGEDAEQETEEAPAPDLLDCFRAGCLQTWQDVVTWGRQPREAFMALKHWQPPSAAGHDIWVETVTDRFEALHQRWIGRGGVRLCILGIGFFQRGRVFWPAVLAMAAVAVMAILATR